MNYFCIQNFALCTKLILSGIECYAPCIGCSSQETVVVALSCGYHFYADLRVLQQTPDNLTSDY